MRKTTHSSDNQNFALDSILMERKESKAPPTQVLKLIPQRKTQENECWE